MDFWEMVLRPIDRTAYRRLFPFLVLLISVLVRTLYFRRHIEGVHFHHR